MNIMNIKRNILLALSALFISGVSSSFASVTLSGKMIERTHANTTHGLYFKTVEGMENPDGCTSYGWYHIKDDSYAKEAFSVAMAAHLAGKKVQFALSGCDGGSVTYPSVAWINME